MIATLRRDVQNYLRAARARTQRNVFPFQVIVASKGLSAQVSPPPSNNDPPLRHRGEHRGASPRPAPAERRAPYPNPGNGINPPVFRGSSCWDQGHHASIAPTHWRSRARIECTNPPEGSRALLGCLTTMAASIVRGKAAGSAHHHAAQELGESQPPWKKGE